MAKGDAAGKRPLWLAIEDQILGLDSQALAGGDPEASIQQMAGALDKAGYKVSKYGGKMLDLRFAMNAARKVGRPLMQDLNTAVAALTLETAADAYAATNKIIGDLAQTWPELAGSKCRPDVIKIVQQARLDLLIAKAKELSGKEGIRYLIEENVAEDVIISALEITAEALAEVNAEIKAERAERKRVAGLLDKVAGKSDQERIKYLFDNNVTEALIKGETVELRNFGVFEVKLRKPRIGRNPNDPGKDVQIPARAVVKFKPGKEMREQVLKLTQRIGPGPV